ncbi:MAG: domain containing protein [Labilithrix sp.]|nr:domain containing protein [Labilithrix sp.]
MITCPKCSKDNQDHYKFCLGCGAELPRDAAPKPFAPQTPSHGVKGAAAASSAAGTGSGPGPVAMPSSPVPAAPPVAAAAIMGNAGGPPGGGSAPSAVTGGATVTCPQCGHINSPSNLFCGSCGFRVGGGVAKPAPAASVPAAANAHAPAGAPSVVLTALRADGTEAGTFAFPSTSITVGRETGAIFAGDSYLSPRHATFIQNGQKVTVKDEASLNGVYKKLVRDVPVELRPHDMFRIGQEIIKFEPLETMAPTPDGVERLGSPAKGYVGRIALVIGREVTGNAFPIPETGVHLGRERGDVLFPEDGYVSGLHCRLSWENGRLLLTDLGSSNGSFMRLHEETEVKSGDVLLMGQQLFRVAV